MTALDESIIKTLAAHPRGLGARDVATAVGGRDSTVSSRLSKLFNYGIIARRSAAGNGNGSGYRAVYMLKKESAP